jgi:hypothetical protein
MKARAEQSLDWMNIKEINGMGNFISTYERFVDGDINPNEGIVIKI